MINIRCLASEDRRLDLSAPALLLLRREALFGTMRRYPFVFDSSTGIRSVLLVEQLNVS